MIHWQEDDGSCGCLGGCTNPSAENYDPNACEDDGSCFFVVFGCTDTGALNYNSLATVDNGSCCYIAGCTNPLYNEYNPFACFDDGSCSVLPGCMDNGGVQMEFLHVITTPDANFDNGTCEYISCADEFVEFLLAIIVHVIPLGVVIHKLIIMILMLPNL